MSAPSQTEDFIESGTRSLQKIRPRGSKPRAGIECAHFLERQEIDEAMAVCGAVERGAWMATTRASRVRCRSVSMKPAPSSTARRNAAIVFSGHVLKRLDVPTTHTATGSLRNLDSAPRRNAPRFAILAELVRSLLTFEDSGFFCQHAASTECKKGRGPTSLWKGDFHEEDSMLVVKGYLQWLYWPWVGCQPGLRPRRAASVGRLMAPRLAIKCAMKLVMLPWYGVFDNLEYQVNGSEVILSGRCQRARQYEERRRKRRKTN